MFGWFRRNIKKVEVLGVGVEFHPPADPPPPVPVTPPAGPPTIGSELGGTHSKPSPEVTRMAGSDDLLDFDDDSLDEFGEVAPSCQHLGGLKTQRWPTYGATTQAHRAATKRLVANARAGFVYVEEKGSDSLKEPSGLTCLKILPPTPKLLGAFGTRAALFLGIRTPHDCWEGLAEVPDRRLVDVMGVEFEVFPFDPSQPGAGAVLSRIVSRIAVAG